MMKIFFQILLLPVGAKARMELNSLTCGTWKQGYSRSFMVFNKPLA